MAHPYQDHKQHKIERSRVGSITRGYATGGGVLPSAGAAVKKKAVRQRDAQAVEGGSAKERQDRPGRARGGRAPTKGKGTNVNVIIAPQGAAGAGAAPPMIPPGIAGPGAGPPPPMPMRPPLPPPMTGAPGPGMPPPGMPPRSHGGRTYATGGAATNRRGDTGGWDGVKGADGDVADENRRVKYARGGAVNAGSNVFNASRKAGTQVQNNPSGKNDQKNVGRGKPITYKTGGAVISAAKGQMGPKFDGGAGGGTARLEKESRAAKNYKRA